MESKKDEHENLTIPVGYAYAYKCYVGSKPV